MSRKQPEQEQDSISWEEAVFRYLEDNPQYFHNNPGLLASLEIPHPETGEAISLIERQVLVLREKNQGVMEQLQELVRFARENDKVSDRLHRFSLAILTIRSLDEALDVARETLTKDFELDGVAIRLIDAGEDPQIEEGELGACLRQVFPQTQGRQKPVCGVRQSSEVLTYMFGDQAELIKSCALVPLGPKGSLGVLALGSFDEERFKPQMGTAYLTKLGDLLSAGIQRYLGH
ncbi:MAG: DUF484 family protein [Gammaproteobacteria bacterium]|nr:DUF484 family protein [Gammaproteobacteria bacterium]